MKKKYSEHEIEEIVEGHLYSAMLAAFDFDHCGDGGEVAYLIKKYCEKTCSDNMIYENMKIKLDFDIFVEEVRNKIIKATDIMEDNIREWKKKTDSEIDYLKFRLMKLENKK